MKQFAALILVSSLTQAARAQDVQVLAEQLKGGKNQAALQLVRAGDKAVRALIDVLKEGDVKARGQAAWALGEIGAKAKDAVPELRRALQDEDAGLAAEASSALGKIGPAAGPELLEVVRKGPESAAMHAARALRHMQVKGAVPVLAAALRKTADTQAQIALIDALAAQGDEAAGAVGSLLEIARTEEGARIHAVAALGRIGPAAKEAVPFLVETLQKKTPGPVTLHAIEAIGKIGVRDPQVTAALLELMKDGQQPRMVLLESLSKAGRVTKESLPAVSQGMRDKDPLVRLYTAQLVGALDPNDLTVVSVLVESLSDKQVAVRKLAAEVLQTVQPRDEAVPDVLRIIADRDMDPAVRAAAAKALAKFKK